MDQPGDTFWSELRQTLGALAFIAGGCLLAVLALAAAFWGLAGPDPAYVVLVLGLPIPAGIVLMFAWGPAREMRVRAITGIDMDEASGVIRFSGFRERVQGRVWGRVTERAVPARSICAVRRTTHGPNWETTVVWLDAEGNERQVLVDEDRLPGGRLSDMLAERLGLTVETRND